MRFETATANTPPSDKPRCCFHLRLAAGITCGVQRPKDAGSDSHVLPGIALRSLSTFLHHPQSQDKAPSNSPNPAANPKSTGPTRCPLPAGELGHGCLETVWHRKHAQLRLAEETSLQEREGPGRAGHASCRRKGSTRKAKSPRHPTSKLLSSRRPVKRPQDLHQRADRNTLLHLAARN